MILIKRSGAKYLFLLSLMTGMFVAGYAIAAEDVVTRALKLYEKHHYEEAAHLLRPEMSGMDSSQQAAASLALGMIYLGNAKLYRDLQQTAQVIELDYLTQLRKQKAGSASRFVDFYLGQALVDAGKFAEGITYLRRFAEQAKAQPVFRALAEIELGVAYSRLKQTQNAAQVWANLDMSKPEIKAALAGAYAVVDAQKQKKPVAMADAALNDAKAQHYIPGSRMLRNLLRAYSHSGETVKALDLLNASEFKEASYVEELGASKSISFYDLSLLEDTANTYLSAAVMYLEQANRDAKLSNTSAYYLASAYLLQGNTKLSLHAAAAFLSQAQIPPQSRDVTRVNQVVAFSRAGQKTDSAATWRSLLENAGEDPVLLTELIQSCAQIKMDCEKLEKMALAAVERGEGKKFFPLNAALGKYYLLKKDYVKAVSYMEAGRDKSNKNKIEVNDPLMLIGLAEAYYRNKKFSENLEIYFELGKQYPAVRQIQDAMQGIYSMEHQSAGDVKIF